MLAYNDIKPKKIIELNGEPYQVLAANVSRKQKQKPVNKTKLKHLINGNVIDHTFQQSENVEEADVDTREVKYMYNSKGEWWFSDPNNSSDRFKIEEDTLGETTAYMKENALVSAMVFNDEIVGVTVPIKMVFEVTDAPPNVKGNTAQGGNKPVVIETGATITTPMFIETGDNIEVNTETREYVKRV